MTPQRFMAWQFELMATALAAGTTIAIRSFGLMHSAAAGRPPDRRESARMLAEKADALSTGLLAATLECSRLW